ncbi:MAG: glycosyltransferase [Cytophagales bacterium]|nr:glycosyltransferase [Cytophagales bacterium]
MKDAHYPFEVSVIVPTYNRSRLLAHTLDSLILQDLDKSRFEVVVGDDGSSDDTRETVRSYESRLNLRYVFQEDKGYRPASARNKAIRMARGKICLMVDAGVLLNANCLAEHVRFHAAKGVPAVAIGYVYGFDHDQASEELLLKLIVPANPQRSIERLSQYPVFSDVREKHYARYADKIEDLPAPWFYFWTCHLSVPAEQLHRAGLFDEAYDGRWGVEDNDLGYRLYRNGVKICLLRTAQSIHYPHGKDKASRHQEGLENCRYFHGKFPCLETRLFLQSYTSTELTDINAMCLQMTGQAAMSE